MAQEPGINQKRLDIKYFEGVNSLVSNVVAKNTEFVHAENARSVQIGSVEKRGGQVVLGTNTTGQPFVTSANYSIFRFQNDQNQNGFYRISVNQNATLSINVKETITVNDLPTFGLGLPITIVVSDSLTVTDVVNNNTGNLVTIYYINNVNQWVSLTGLGTSIPGGTFDFTYAETNLFLVNFNSNNRYIKPDGVTVVDSTSGSGHLYNSPPASKVNYYKQRLYLADFTYSGVRYPTTVLRSSYAMGIIALINTDSASHASGGSLDVIDTKYFYTASGANTYDVYRGQTLISTITVTTINETSIVVTHSGTPSFLASDEIWISGTYTGEKVFRWVNNATISGQNIKQYDTFKLSGGDNSPITLFENIGNVMLIATPFSMASWNDYTLENFDINVGCVSKKGYVKLLGTLYFIHYEGIYATTGSVPKLISSKVQRYITGATKVGKEASAGGKKGTSVFFTLGDVTLYRIDGSVDKVLSNVCLEYNTIQQNWYVHTNVKANDFETYIETTNTDRLMLADTVGNHAVKEFLSGETDDGTEIQFLADTMRLTLQSGWENVNNLISVLVDVDRGSSSQVFIDLNNGEGFYPLPGNLRKGLSNIKVQQKDSSRGEPPVARLVSISIRDSSKQLCKFSRISLILVPTTNDDSNTD